MKKRFTSILIAILLLITSCMNTACGKKDMAETGNLELNEILTREQWIIGLGSMFGMNEFTTEEAFFNDVESTREVYPYLQSCAEWGIFESVEGDFNPQKAATREFAIQTAVIAAEVLRVEENANLFEQSIVYAREKGIITSDTEDYLDEEITCAEGQAILDWAVEQYQNCEFVEYANVEVNETVIDLSDSDMQLALDTGTVTIFEDNTKLQVGDVFIAPGNEEAPDGIARKVIEVSVDEHGRQVVETAEPALEEIYKELDFAVRAVPDETDVVTYEGVTLVSIAECDTLLAEADAYNVYAMSIVDSDYDVYQVGKTENGTSFGFEINFTKGTPTLNGSWESSFGKFEADMEPQEPELQPGEKAAGEWFNKSSVLYSNKGDGKRTIDKIENKFKGGYEITGALSIKDLYVDVEAETEKVLGFPVGVKNFSVETHYQVESTLTLKGSLEEELKLTTFHIQTPVPGLTVKLEVMLYANADGELEVKFVTNNCTTTSYESGKVKKVDSSTAEAPDLTVALDVEVGVAVKAAPCVLGKEIVDVKVKGGVKFRFTPGLETENRSLEKQDEILEIKTWFLTFTGEVTMPIVKLEVGTSDKCLLKLEMKWELVGENGLIKVERREMFKKRLRMGEEVVSREPKEVLEDIEEAATTETISNSEAETPEMQDDNKAEDGILGEAEVLNIDSYMVGIKVGESATIAVTSIPKNYTMSDIYWECDNTSVATISDGIITGVGAGITQIKVSTSDGKYEIFCTVIVRDDTKVDFNAL